MSSLPSEIHPSARYINNLLCTHFLLLLLISCHAKLIYCLFVQSEKASGLSFLSREFSAREALDIKPVPSFPHYFSAQMHTQIYHRLNQGSAIGGSGAICSPLVPLQQPSVALTKNNVEMYYIYNIKWKGLF